MDTTPALVPIDDEILDGVVGGWDPIGQIREIVL